MSSAVEDPGRPGSTAPSWLLVMTIGKQLSVIGDADGVQVRLLSPNLNSTWPSPLVVDADVDTFILL